MPLTLVEGKFDLVCLLLLLGRFMLRTMGSLLGLCLLMLSFLAGLTFLALRAFSAAFFAVFLAGFRLANFSAARFVASLVAQAARLIRPPFFAAFVNLATFKTGQSSGLSKPLLPTANVS